VLRAITLKEDVVFKRTIPSHLVTTQPLRRVQHLQVWGGRSAESDYGFRGNRLFSISFSLLHNSTGRPGIKDYVNGVTRILGGQTGTMVSVNVATRSLDWTSSHLPATGDCVTHNDKRFNSYDYHMTTHQHSSHKVCGIVRKSLWYVALSGSTDTHSCRQMNHVVFVTNLLTWKNLEEKFSVLLLHTH